MKRIRYSLATSLDGYIATTDGGYDWIEMDPSQAGAYFERFYAQFDTAIMGRKSFDQYGRKGVDGMDTYVFSKTLDPAGFPDVTVLCGEDGLGRVRELRTGKGKDIWLFGGGETFGTLARAGLVDTVEVAIFPVLLGGGIPMLAGDSSVRLRHVSTEQALDGVVSLTYAVDG